MAKTPGRDRFAVGPYQVRTCGRVKVGSEVLGQRADTVDQRERELWQRPVEFFERLRDPVGGESRVDTAEPRLGESA